MAGYVIVIVIVLRYSFFISISLHRRIYSVNAELTHSYPSISHFSILRCNASQLTGEYWFVVMMLNGSNNENEIKFNTNKMWQNEILRKSILFVVMRRNDAYEEQ